jgi:nucleoside-diphosphate-sugar epimerase
VKVFLTGATGFVGRAVLRRLQADGHEIAAAYHRQPGFAAKDVHWVRMELASPTASWEMPAGIHVVIHLAALAHSRASAGVASDIFRINRDGTAMLAESAARAGARRFLFLSSVKACGELSLAGPWTENDPRQPSDPYGEAKSQAEDRVAEIASGSGMEMTILRPPLIYGPGVRANFLSMLRWIDRGLPLPVAPTPNLRSLVFVGNLADALARCVVHPAVSGRTYFVSDGEDVSTVELARRIGKVLDRPARTIKVPMPLLRLAAVLTGRAGAAERLAGSLCVDSSRIRADLGWVPPYTMASGLVETVKWYRDRDSAVGRVV